MGLNSLIAQDQLLIELEFQEGIKLVDRTQRMGASEVSLPPFLRMCKGSKRQSVVCEAKARGSTSFPVSSTCGCAYFRVTKEVGERHDSSRKLPF